MDSECSLPTEFQDANKLSIPEVAIILSKIQTDFDASQRGMFKNANTRASTLLGKSVEYAKTFNRFPNCDVIQKVRNALEEHDLTDFEVVQLSNLVPESPDEARSLIPSLIRIESEQTMSDIVEELKRLKTMSFG